MKYCAMPGCRKNSGSRPELIFFPLPKDPSLRDEWCEILNASPRKRELNPNSPRVVCELHFKERDFKASRKLLKKELKVHAVPCLHPESEDIVEDIVANRSDLQIIPITINTAFKPELINSRVKKEPVEDIIPEPEPEVTGRRSSRRAALAAAKKIHETAVSYEVKLEPENNPVLSSPTPRLAAATPPKSRGKRTRKPNVFIDLEMECSEDSLTTAQSRALVNAQVHYNTVMKNLRELAAAKVKIVQEDEDGNEIIPPPLPKSVKNNPNLTVVKSPKAQMVPLQFEIVKSRNSRQFRELKPLK